MPRLRRWPSRVFQACTHARRRGPCASAHTASCSMSGQGKVLDPDHRGAEVKAGEVALRGLVVPGGDTSPGLQLVDQPLDGVALLVEVGVVAHGSAAPAALLLPVCGLVLLLRDDGLDATLP